MRSDPAHRYENYGSGLPAPAPALAMLSVMIAVGMASLDTAIANTALPTMAKQLSTSPVASLWIVNSYQLAMVATLLSFAALGEIGGYRRVFIVGLALFTAASLGCALALSLPALIVARLVQGIGASAVMSVATALMRIIYPPHLHGRAFGINALVVAMAFAVGPTVASLILAVLSWPWLFAINVPVGIVAWSLARRVLPETVPNSQSFDQLAALYSIGAFGSLILLFGDAAHAAGPQRWGGGTYLHPFLFLPLIAQTARTSLAAAAYRSLSQSFVHTFGAHFSMYLRGAGVVLRLTAFLFRKHRKVAN